MDADGSEYSKIKVPRGRRIFNEGESGDVAYIVETGEIGIFKNINGVEVEIAALMPGEIFGEIAILAGQERLASAVALVDSSLVAVSPRALEARIAKSDKFVKTLLSILMTNLRDTHRVYTNPKLGFDGNIKALRRQCNALSDIIHLTHDPDFVDATDPEIKTIREKCDKLVELSEARKS